MAVEHLNNGVVYNKRSRRGIVFDKINIGVVLAEDIHDKRFWFVSDLVN